MGGVSSGTIVTVIANFVSDIPFPVWFAIGCVIVFLLNYYVKQAIARSKGAVPAPRDVRKAGKEKDWNKLNEHHTPKLRGSRKALATDARARLLAPSFPYALCHGNPVDALAVTEPGSTKDMLARDWGITSRSDLLHQLYWLLREGHRKDFGRTREQCNNPSWLKNRLARLDEIADKQTDAWEERWRIHRFLNNERSINDVDFGAWDFIRAAMLTRSGAALGYLTDEEAWDTLALINRALQLSYSSWNEAWDAFRLTRWLWAAEGVEQEAENDLHERNRGEFLIGANGLWTAIPWDTPSVAPRFLLLDALQADNGLTLLSYARWQDASAWERELDMQARTRAPLSIGGKPIVQ